MNLPVDKYIYTHFVMSLLFAQLAYDSMIVSVIITPNVITITHHYHVVVDMLLRCYALSNKYLFSNNCCNVAMQCKHNWD